MMACFLLGRLSSRVVVVACQSQLGKCQNLLLPTFPFFVGMLPFITVGEFGANLPYLNRRI